MAPLGVDCDVARPAFEMLVDEEAGGLEDTVLVEDDALLAAGRAWTQDDNPAAGIVFRALADEMIAGREPAKVAEICEQLIGEGTRLRVADELSALSVRAQERLQPVPDRWYNSLRHLTGE